MYLLTMRSLAFAVQDVWHAPPLDQQGHCPGDDIREIPSVAELTATCRDFPPGFRAPRDDEDDPDGDAGGAAPGSLTGAVIATVV